jgi:hypothetical protein
MNSREKEMDSSQESIAPDEPAVWSVQPSVYPMITMNTQRRAETEAVAPDEPNRGSGSFGSP